MKGGFGGFGGGNMQQMMKQAQAMQQQLQKKKQQLEEQEYSATSGGGMVSLSMNGAFKVLELKIKSEVVDADDVEMLEDLVTACINECCEQIATDKDALTGGML